MFGDYMPYHAVIVMSVMCVIALIVHAMDVDSYRVQGAMLSHLLLLLGWSALAFRTGMMAFQVGDNTITWAGGIGVMLLAAGMTARLVRRKR